MSIIDVFNMFAGHLIEVMGSILIIAIVFRFFAYKAGKADAIYFNTFSKSVEKLLEEEKFKGQINDTDEWLENFLTKITEKLPSRGVRYSNTSSLAGQSSFRNQQKERFDEFADGKKSIIHSTKQNKDLLKSSYQPNFKEFTTRILKQDKKWQTVLGIIPIDTLSRMLDILPGLFIVGGIFGTFIGITSALPEITKLNLNDLEQAAETINGFVTHVAFSMNTSISGIIYSVVLTILNTVFPLASTRNEIKKNLERSYEFIWKRLHGTELSYGDQQTINLLSRMCEIMENGHGVQKVHSINEKKAA